METAQGLLVSTSSFDAIERINAFQHQILSAGARAEEILAAAAQHPDCLLIQTYAGAFYLFAQEDQASQTAQTYLLQAEKNLLKANEREKLSFQAINAWFRKDFECAATLFSAIAMLYPRDTLALKLAEWMFYCCGQAFNARRYLHLCESVAHENQGDPWFLSCYSFALELSGKYSEAKAVAEKAMSIETVTPWAQHSMAHIYLMTGQRENGLRFMHQVRPSWKDIMPLMRGHNAWHLALFYLAGRDEQSVLDLYRSDVWGNMPDTILEQVDAISMLWRMDLAGLAQDTLFKDVAARIARHPMDCFTGFNAVHFIYCLARAGDGSTLQQALTHIEAFALSLTPGQFRKLWLEVIIPFCNALVAFVHKDYVHAHQLLQPIIADCFQLGGSDAQCELFLQTYLICLIACNKQKEARLFFERHLSHYKNSELENYWFSARHH
ncbi:tetratricopeptide repeat protein [Legionella sp. CNM-4043-24]|uniref:tetratricopeptide repeat protein n=1 Tax=Legionella sp. CNM-4043-24 TaxID=3421646 RepID=UPI00403AED89